MSERDWTEDFTEENGNYQNDCCRCTRPFLGNKRRLVCKVCDPDVTPDDIVKVQDGAVQVSIDSLPALCRFIGDAIEDHLKWLDGMELYYKQNPQVSNTYKECAEHLRAIVS